MKDYLKKAICGEALTVDQFVLNDNFFSGVVTVPVGMIVNRFVVERIIERFKPVARI